MPDFYRWFYIKNYPRDHTKCSLFEERPDSRRFEIKYKQDWTQLNTKYCNEDVILIDAHLRFNQQEGEKYFLTLIKDLSFKTQLCSCR